MPATLKSSTLETDIDCNGTPKLIVSEQDAGENLEDFAARHEAEVAAAVAACGGTSSTGLSGYVTPVVCGAQTTNVVTQQIEEQSWEDFLAAHYAAVRVKVRACP